MRTVSGILYYTGISWLLYSALVLLSVPFEPFFSAEFNSHQAQVIHHIILSVGFPIAILLTLFKIGIKAGYKYTLERIVATIVIFVFSLLFSYMYLAFGDMCRYINGNILFENKYNSTIKIIYREFSCGAWDSDEPNRRIVSITPLTNDISLIVQFDTTNIDNSQWKRIVK